MGKTMPARCCLDLGLTWLLAETSSKTGTVLLSFMGLPTAMVLSDTLVFFFSLVLVGMVDSMTCDLTFLQEWK